MKKLLISAAVLFQAALGFSQTNPACRLVLDENFNQYPGALQTYTESAMKADFGSTSGPYKGLTGLTKVGNGTIQAFFGKGKLLGEETGFSWFNNLPAGITEAVMEYRLKFSDGYDWTKGGKLPGLSGGNSPRGCTDDNSNGFSARLMWRQNGGMVTYYYGPGNNNRCGTDWQWSKGVQSGRWYTIRQQIKLNTPGVPNGILEMYLDGQLVLKKTDIMFRTSSAITISKAYITTYVGGSTDEFRPSHDQQIWFDDFKVWVGCSNLGTTTTNNAPTNVNLSSASLMDNAAIGTTAGTLSSSDPNAGNTFTYSLVSGTGSTDNASFAISGNTLRTTKSLLGKSSANVRIRTTDQGGLWFEKSFTIAITKVVLNIKPSVSFASPSASSVFTAPFNLSPVVNASDADGSIVSVDLYLNNVLVRREGLAPYTWNTATQNDAALDNLPKGNYTLKAVATDNMGASSETSIGFSVQSVIVTDPCAGNSAPSVSITAPAAASSFAQGVTVTISANASDNASVTSVEFFNGSTSLGKDLTSPYSVSVSTFLPGSYSIRAVATDNCGASSAALSGSFTITAPVSTDPIFGPGCGAAKTSLSFELTSSYRKNVTGYSWWFTGSADAVTPVAGTPYKASVALSQYYNGGSVCVGTNLSVAPYYVSYCKPVGVCGARIAGMIEENMELAEAITLYPNPSAGQVVTIQYEKTPTSMELRNNKGIVLKEFFNTNAVETSGLVSGVYTLKLVFENEVVVKQLLVQ